MGLVPACVLILILILVLKKKSLKIFGNFNFGA